jgi:hypothetical protein
MGRVLRVRTGGLVVALLALFFAAPAGAAPVLVLKDGHVKVRHERFAGRSDFPRASNTASPRSSTAAVTAAKAPRAPKGRATRQALDVLLSQGLIDQPTHDARLASINRALRAYRKLTGTRKTQLGAVIDNADAMSAAGKLTPSRLNAVFATLDANTEWWTTGPLLSGGRRVSVGDSPLIWQYYPGQGIQLQMLGNWSKANALFQGHDSTGLRDLVDALVPLAADRGGWPAWEYYFRFGGGAPPWTSSISQGTALQALARAGQRLRDTSLWDLGRRALEAFQVAPPDGVRDNTPNGAFYLIYSYAPNQLVINAHLQALIGLFDFAKIAGDGTAQTLFQQGDAEAQAVLPRYDTGHWSLYDQTTESDLNYHQLVTGFLDNLCRRTSTPIYCDTAQRFNQYMKEPPQIALTTRQVRAGAPAKIRFSLDKVSRIGIVIVRGGKTFLSTSATFGRGSRFFTWSRPGSAGTYDVTLTARDLSGNRGDAGDVTLRVLPRAHR